MGIFKVSGRSKSEKHLQTEFKVLTSMTETVDYVKTVRIRSYSGPHFTAFRLNTGTCGPE